MLGSYRYGLARYLVKKIEEQAERQVKGHAILRDFLEYYGRNSPSTGCSYADYLLLYRYIKNHNPKEVLECGTGFSTVVIAQALKENEEEYGVKGHLVSMEQNGSYHAAAIESLPPPLKNDPRLEIVLSPVMEDTCGFFRGIRYKEVPKRAYDFVFVDGPDSAANPTNKPLTLNCDFVKLVSENEHPTSALIDTRVGTCFMYSLLFPGKFRYDYLRKVGIVESVTKNDLADSKKVVTRVMEKREFHRPPIATLIRGEY